LTLLDTGKTTPAPVVLLDTPDGLFWTQWRTFVDEGIVRNHYLGSGDMSLVRFVTSVVDAVDEIEHFYSNYVSFAVDGDRGVVTLHRLPTDAQLATLKRKIPTFDTGLGYRVESDDSLSFNFDGRNYLYLRLVIDEVNSWSDQSSS
jgi:hypothetical protein